MAAHGNPIVGNWYQDPASGEAFEVIGIGDEEDAVEVRYLGRGRRTLDFETWQALKPVQVEGPREGPSDTARSPSEPPPGGR